MAVVLDALASYLQNMLTEMVKDEVHMLLGVSGQIDKMAVKLMDLKKFLADADKRNITDEIVQGWVKELRDAMYAATDILELCQLKAAKQGHSIDAGCFNPLLFCMRNPIHAHDIGSRIKSLNQRLDDIEKRSTAFKFNLGSYEDRTRTVRRASRETSGELIESGLVGDKIEEDARNLVKMLTKGHEAGREGRKIVVFAIVGVGGIGKTTLAQKIFNDEAIQQEFTKKIWLSVNKDFSETKLLRRAIEALGGHQIAGNTKVFLEQTLKQLVAGHRTLLVMDVVWDHRAWKAVLETPLTNALAWGSRVLITTRDNSVARRMSAQEPYHHVFKLEPEDAWSLLKKEVVGNEDTEAEIDKLKDIGVRIIARCGHLPLAVKVIGGLLCLKKKTEGDWEKVLNDSLMPGTKMPEELNYAVYLSYQDLHPCLKQCFLHLCLLPLYYTASDIVAMWISEGFVQGKSHELEELGRGYYDELVSRNLIEPVGQYIAQDYCQMHEVVRSFGQYYISRDEALVANMGETDITSKLNSRTFLRLSLWNQGSESNLESSCLKAQKSLRTLVLSGPIKIKHGDSLIIFSSLRTLDLYSTNCDPLVESLCQLKHLRHLSMHNCNISGLPETIDTMKLLNHLRITGNKGLLKLPDNIVKLRQLRNLYIDDTGINKTRKQARRCRAPTAGQ